MEKLKQDLLTYKNLSQENRKLYVQSNAQLVATQMDLQKQVEENRLLANRMGKISQEAVKLYKYALGVTTGEYTLEDLKNVIAKTEIKSILILGG